MPILTSGKSLEETRSRIFYTKGNALDEGVSMDWLNKMLSIPDEVFLNFEKRQQPMHVAGLQLFEIPENASNEYVLEQVEWMRTFNSPTEFFSLSTGSLLGKSYWKEDHQFDLEHHLRFHALPQPSRIRELLSFVSAEHSNLMDRHRPLWECHVIEGLPNQRFAIYTKLHHAMTDGVSAMRMLNRSLTTAPRAHKTPPFWALDDTPKNSSENLSALLSSTLSDLKSQLISGKKVSKELFKQLGKDANDINFQGAPTTLLNTAITGSRRYAAQSYSLGQIKRLAKALDCTINDIVLYLCSTTLRSYLRQNGGLPSKPLIAAVPVSLRQDNSVGGNNVGLILVNLHTHQQHPELRFKAIRDSVTRAKRHFQSLTPIEAQNFTTLMLAPTLFHFLTGLAPTWQAFNLIVSNVPGPKDPLYLNDAKLAGMYPVSIVIDQMALNITVTSYCDSLEFGFTACRRSVPSMQTMLEMIDGGLLELAQIAGLTQIESRIPA